MSKELTRRPKLPERGGAGSPRPRAGTRCRNSPRIALLVFIPPPRGGGLPSLAGDRRRDWVRF